MHDRGELAEARQMLERALEIDEKVLGPGHISLITRLNYLGRCLKSMGAADEANRCYERAAGILRQLRDPNAEGGDREAEANQQAQAVRLFAATTM